MDLPEADPVPRRAPRAAGALGVLAIASSLLGQTASEPRFKESVEVRADEIQALAVDATGRPVLDLRPEEFVLTVDGVARKIDWVLPPSLTGVHESGAPNRGEESKKTAPASPATAPSTVFFVDEIHLDFRTRYLGLRALRLHLDSIPADEDVAVYSFRDRLQLVQQFTTDRAGIAAALARLGRTVPASNRIQDSRGAWIAQSRAALDELSRALQSIAGHAGPKTVVVLAGYLPMNSFELPDPFHSVPFDFREDIQRGVDEALLARATIVALDPAGIPPFGTGAERQDSQWAARQSSESASGAANTPANASGTDLGPESAPVPSDSLSSGGDAFAVLARETGGARLYLSNQPEDLLAREEELLRCRYRIGFTPDAQSSRTRRIALRVTRPGVRVRTASGQRSLFGEALVRARFSSFLLKADAAPSDFPIRIINVKKTSGSRGPKSLSLEIEVPLRDVFLEKTTDSVDGHVEILAAAVQDDGTMSDVQSEQVEVHVSRQDASRLDRSYFKKAVSLQVEGRGSVLIGVRDTTTNRVGLARLAYGR